MAGLVASGLPSEAVEALSASFEFLRALPFTYLFVGHCLFCSLSAPEFRDRAIFHYLLTFLWGNGGGTVTAFVLMAPQHAKLAFFASNEILGIWTICWWLMNYFPGGWPRKLVELRYVKLLARSCTAWCRAMLIISRVDLAVKLFPGIVAAPLLLGTLAGCGGRLIADCLLHNWQGLPGNAELTSPSFVSRSAALAATTYYLLAYATQLLPQTAAAGLVVTVLVLHPSASELTGRPLDFTKPVATLLHTITRIPEPPPQPHTTPVAVHSRHSQQVKPSTPKGKATPSKSPVKQRGAAAAAEETCAATTAAAASASPAAKAAARQAPGKAGRGSAGGGGAADSSVALTATAVAGVLGETVAAARPRRSTRRAPAGAV